MSIFADAVHAASTREVSQARNDPERMAAMIEVLARALGFSISICAAGDSKMIDTLMVGAEAYAHEEAVEKAPVAKMLRSLAGGMPR